MIEKLDNKRDEIIMTYKLHGTSLQATSWPNHLTEADLTRVPNK